MSTDEAGRPMRPGSAGQGGLGGFLIQELGLLIVEAKKKNADVKDAADLLLALVKSLAGARPNPTLNSNDAIAKELAKTSDTVRPFVLACESKNPKLVPIAIGCLQRLTMHQAIPSSSVAKVLRTMADQLASLDQNVQLKMLQTVLPLLTSYKLNVGGDAIIEALGLCYRLQDSKSPIVNSIATATLRQIVLHAFEKVDVEDETLSTADDSNMKPFAKDACMLFQDLCLLAVGENTSFWRVSSLPKAVCLEFIESILKDHANVFKKHEAMLAILKERVCPMLMRSFSDKSEFPLLVRLLRVIHVLVKSFHDVLAMESEIFLSLYIKLLETDHGPPWLRVLVLESIKGLCSTEGFLRDCYESYDAKTGATKVVQDMLGAVARILVSEKQASLIIPREVPDAPVTLKTDAPNPEVFVGLASTMLKTPCMELLDKDTAPTLPENYITAVAIQCILNATDAQVNSLLPRLIAHIPQSLLSPTSPGTPVLPVLQDELLQAIEIATSTFPVTIATLAVLLIGNVDLEVYKITLRTYMGYTALIGLLGLVQQRDALIQSVCRITTPPTVILSCDASAAVRELTSFSSAAAQNFQTRVNHPMHLALGERNLMAMVSVAGLASQLESVLSRETWFFVLETLQAVEGMHSSGKTERRETVNPAADGVKMVEGGRKLSLNALANVAIALAGIGSGGNVDMNLVLALKNLFEGSKMMEEKGLKEFVGALCLLSKDSAVQAASSALEKKESGKVVEDKSFAVGKLHEVFTLNVGRFVDPAPGEMFGMVVGCLIDIAHSQNCTPGIRAQVSTVFGDILALSIQHMEENENDKHGIRNGEIVEMALLEPLKRFMLVSADDVVPTGVPLTTGTPTTEVERVVKGPWFVDVQKVGLETVKKILMSSGHNLVHGWFLIFEVIRSVVVGGRKLGGASGGAVSSGALMNMVEASNSLDAAQSSKAAILVRSAFPSVQLVCGDFLGSLSPDVLFECIQTLGCFGSQPDDINISLTTIGLLWNISDNILTRRQKLEKEGKVESPANRSNPSLHVGSVEKLDASNGTSALSIPQNTRAMLTSRENITGPVTTKTMDVLWMHLLAHLSQLCSDLRPEVRNSANQTIFKTITINGRRLTLEAWDECIWNILFPLLERVKISSEQAELIQQAPQSNALAASGIPINPRDSPTKFWNETKTLTLTGITNLIIQFFPVLIDLGSGFEKTWSLFLDYIRSWALGGGAEVSATAIKSLKSLVRYTKDLVEADGTPGKVAPAIEKKMSELWRVAWDVWEALGQGIVAGADENKGVSEPVQSVLVKSASGFGSQLIDVEKLKAIHGPFPQATLVQYVSVFGDIHEVIASSFGLYELKRLLNVLSSLLLYHTTSPEGATVSKYKTDNVSDLETMSPFQEAVFNLITGTSPDFAKIQGAPEIIILCVAGFIRLPFVRLQSLSDAEKEKARLQPATGGMEKGFTYMTLAKRSIQCLVNYFEAHGSALTVYSGGIFEAMLACLDVPMRAKYDCPCPGTKDSTPLWRCAANASMTLVVMGLKNLEKYISALPKEILNSIYFQILEMFDGFLLPQSNPPSTMSMDELEVATSFDISIFETFEEDVLLHLGQLHVSDDLVKQHVEIICRCSKLYKSHMSSMLDISLPSSGVPTVGAGTLRSAQNSVTAPTHNSSLNLAKKILRDDVVSSPRGSLSSIPNVSVQPITPQTLSPKKMNLGTDVMPYGRENFSKVCLVSMVKLCSDELTDMKDARQRIATIAAPIVLDKMKEVITSYSSDRPLYGRLPLPRIRGEEILLVLSHLRDLQMRPGVLHQLIAEDKIHPLRSHILSGRSAHLFYLYPQLVDLMAAVAKAGRGSSMSPADVDEETLVDLVSACLSRVGREMGLDS